MPDSFQFAIDPLPDALERSPFLFDLDPVRRAFRHVLALNAITPVSRAIFAQSQIIGRDVHQFQVFFRDARSWIEQVEFLGGDMSKPNFKREDPGFAFGFDEWTEIGSLKNAIIAMHVALSSPKLIQTTFADQVTTTLLNVDKDTVARGDPVGVGWHASLAGHLDWVAMYAVGAPNTSYLAYKYVPDNQVDGDFEFSAPVNPGTYVFRYLVANSYSSSAESPPFTVT